MLRIEPYFGRPPVTNDNGRATVDPVQAWKMTVLAHRPGLTVEQLRLLRFDDPRCETVEVGTIEMPRDARTAEFELVLGR